MKKLLCLILSTLICTSGIVVANAETKSTYFAFTYGGGRVSDNVHEPFYVRYEDLNSLGVKVVAEKAKNHLDNMPEGRRCLNLTSMSNKMAQNAETSIFWDKGANTIKEMIMAFIKVYHSIGGKLDYCIDDMEAGMSNWALKDSAKVHLIEENPRYVSEVRPLLEERGYTFGSEEQGDLYYLWNWSAHKTAYLIWNNVMNNRIADYYNDAIYEPIKALYPDVKHSNYGFVDSNGESQVLDVAGHRIYLGGATKKVGTHSSPVIYGAMNQITATQTPPGYERNEFLMTAFNGLLKEMIVSQSASYSTEGNKLMPWIGLKTWTNEASYKNFMRTDYYAENVFHLGLLGADPFLVFDIGGDDEQADREYLSKLLKELDAVTGNEKGEVIKTDIIGWKDRFVMSGVNLSDKSLWRITPDLYTKGVSIESFKVSDTPLTFAISNKKIIFPEGSSIIGNNMSNYGYWVSAPKNANVQIVTDETLTAAGAPVKTDDYIPTGYMYETDVTKIENKPAEETKQEEIKEETKEPEPQKSEISGHWAEKQLKKAVSAGVMQGTDKGLEPDKVLTKAELITMLCRGTGVGMSDYAGYFDDIAGGEWYAPYAGSAVKYQWLPSGGSFNPNEPVSRAETSLIMARVLGVNGGNTTLTDIGSYSAEVQQAISGLSERGIITGYPDGTFKGENSLTRAEAAVILYRSIL